MKELTTNQLKQIEGGSLSWTAFLLLSAGITFIIGVIDGFLRPLPCH